MEVNTRDTPRAVGTWKRRLAVVAGAVVAAVVLYLILTVIVGDLNAPAPTGQEGTINVGMVIFSSAFASLLAWALLAVLEKFTAKARVIWTVVAAVVFVLSLGGPLGGDVDTGSRVGLLLLHVVVAAVLIPMLPSRSAQPKQAA